jgi:hypothetical protein
VLFAFALALSVPQAAPKQAQLALVQQLIERTQTTQAPYALVSRNEIRRDDATIYEFGAEFNQGDLHRVETPRDRIVTNCRTGWNAHLNVATGAITHDDSVSGMACGVYTGDGIVNAEITGTRSSRFGLLQELKINTVGGLTRMYGIAANGAIVSEEIVDPAGRPRLLMTAMSLSNRLPSTDLFSEASLAKSAVPNEEIKQASEPPK